MKILEELKRRADLETADESTPYTSNLYVLAKEIAKEAGLHLKQIIKQMPDFDIHDSDHSEKILENIEAILSAQILEKLSCYELFLLYLSCYLHDAAMALPEFELRLLKLTEGTKLLKIEEYKNNLLKDMVSPCTHTEAFEIIETKKMYLYKSFETIKEFIFIAKCETEFKTDLCERLIEYQEFRNGYSDELKKIVDEGDTLAYKELSSFILQEFIRSTHAKRVALYVKNLAPLFVARLGDNWGYSLALDLAKICRSHGEDFEFVQKFETQTSYYGKETTNLQFIAIILRLGDVLHLSFDRASKSLFAEKMIDSTVSLKHWKAKFQGLNYSLDGIDSDGKIKIKYMAFCDNPESFYFIHEYINYVDDELSNYYKFIGSMEYYGMSKHLVPRYSLTLPEKVDRSQIRHDEEKFTPILNLGFTLDQKRILELLMGVGLYKNKYYALREIYQNSLDACRCMIATYENNNITTRGHIEFGLKTEIIDGKTRKYLYCIDNGLGMNTEIVKEYFLRIGNSYYNSRAYKRFSSKLKNSFQPISQFGIGILSCFMIANRIEITSVSLDEKRNSSEPIRFAMDGPHARFYYMKPDSFDLELIGTHGTLLKLYLKPEEDKLNTKHFDNLLHIIFGQRNYSYVKKNSDLYSQWDNNIFSILLNLIGISSENVDLYIRYDDGEKMRIFPHHTFFHMSSLFEDEQYCDDFDYVYKYSDGYNPAVDYVISKDFICKRILKISVEGVDFYTLLSLPLPNIPTKDFRVLSFIKMLRERVVLNDGIVVDEIGPLNDFEYGHDILDLGIIDFVGMERPQLSVDRRTITGLSKKLHMLMAELPDKIAERLVDEINNHLKTYNIDEKSEVGIMIWDYIFSKYSSISAQLLEKLLTQSKSDFPLNDIKQFLKHETTLREFSESTKIIFDKFDYRQINRLSNLLFMNKLILASCIELNDLSICIESKSISSIKQLEGMNEHTMKILFKVDKWNGIYEEFDIITSIWPLIHERLFSKIEEREFRQDSTTCRRFKQIYSFSNTLSGIGELESVSVHPKLGFFSDNKNPMRGKVNRVKKFGNAIQNIFFPEINNFESRKSKKCFVLYVFISPSVLSPEERQMLETIRDNDVEYYDGVINGLSVLFFDLNGYYIMKTGLNERAEMLKLVNKTFWEENKEIEFFFLDGTQVQIGEKIN